MKPSKTERMLAGQELSRVFFSIAAGARLGEDVAKDQELSVASVERRLRQLSSIGLVTTDVSGRCRIQWGRVVQSFLDLAGRETSVLSDVQLDEDLRKHLDLKAGEGLGEWQKIRGELERNHEFAKLLRFYFRYVKQLYLTPPDIYPGVTFASLASAFEPALAKIGPFLQTSESSRTGLALARWYNEVFSITGLEEMTLREALADLGLMRLPESLISRSKSKSRKAR